MFNVLSPGDSPPSLYPITPDVLTPNISEDSTLINPLNNLDEFFRNTSCSQNNLAVDNETLKNNGSCGGTDANGQVSDNSQDVVYNLILQIFPEYFKSC